MLITNANIKTMEKKDISNAYILIQDGIIRDLGKMEDLFLEDDETLDVQGSVVLPGLIDAHSHLGMWEDGLGFEGDDGNEDTDPTTPHLRAIDAVNPMDYCFSEALQAGITTVLTGPGSANPISGSWCAMKTHGRRIEDMLVRENAGMKFALGENPKSVYHGKGQTPITRMGTAALIREELTKAKRYLKALNQSKKDDEVDPPEYDAKSEALLPVLQRKTKAFFHAHRADDIFTAIRISREFKLDYVIVHATEGHKVADILAQEKAKVIAGPIICDRSKPELRNLNTRNAAVLHEAGVTAAICTDHPVIPIQYLGMSAAICVRNGLPYEEALKMLTIIPAKICGIEKRVGSIRVGKDADFVIVSDDILNVYTQPDYVIMNGRIVVNNRKKEGDPD